MKYLTLRDASIRSVTIICLTIMLLAICQLGCAVKTAPPGLSTEIRSKLGTIAVAPALFAPEEPEFHTPTKGKAKGAMRGAATGAIGVALGSAELFPLIIFAPVYPVLIGTGAVIGGACGAGVAHSKAEVQKAEAAYEQALATVNIQQVLGKQIFESGRILTPYPFVFLDQGPGVINQNFHGKPLTVNAISTILEVSVLTFGLKGEGQINPPLHISMTVNTRLVRAADRQVLYDRMFEYTSEDHKFAEWGAHDARLFRMTVGHACQELSEEIVGALFLD